MVTLLASCRLSLNPKDTIYALLSEKISFLVPKILAACTEFIEKESLVDGVYRISGIASNIKRLRYVHFILGNVEVVKIWSFVQLALMVEPFAGTLI